MTLTKTNSEAEGQGAQPCPDGLRPPDANAMRDCLLRLRDRAAAGKRDGEVRDIDATLSGDAEAQVRTLVGTATLTPRQRDVLVFLWKFRQEHGFAPTLREIGEANGISKVTAMEHLDAMQDKGVLVRDRWRSRSLTFLNAPGAAADAK